VTRVRFSAPADDISEVELALPGAAGQYFLLLAGVSVSD
jgi:hypothetical protein